MVADCQSILYIDPVRKAVGAAHAGWRGTVGGIAAAVVDAMAAEFGCEAHNISAAFGPGIRPCSYEVDAPVYGRAFARLGQRAENCFVLSRPGHWWFDLIRFNQLILEERGVTRFETLGGCTACEADRYFSYRREGAASGRMVASICLS
jgi:YfiH family protein